MAPPYENQSPLSPFNLELSGDHHQYHHLFNLEEPHDHQTSFSSSSLSSPMFCTPPPDHDQPQPPSQYREPQKFQFQLLEADKIGSYGGSCDDQTLENEGGGNGTVLKLSISKNGAQRNGGDAMNNSSSVKWMSSKMRIMRKMTNPDQTSSSSTTTTTTTTSSDEKPISMSHKMSSSSNNANTAPIIRVCSDCNTTKTPLWRSGPRGPKSLCNACGIRQRKARRAMAAAAAAANGTTLAAAAAAGGAPSAMKSSSASKVVQHKENKSRVGSTVPFKKRPYKLTSSSSSSTSPSSRGNKSSNKKLCTFEDFTITMNTNGSSGGGGGGTTTTTTTTTTSAALHQRVFPQDEKEAAILLMALSCGLVHG